MSKKDLKDLELEATLDLVKVSAAEEHRRLHQEWVASGKDPEKLKPLLNKFQPVIDRKINQLKGPQLVNEDSLRLQAQAMTVRAFETYDPKKSALNTHVQNHLKGLLRPVIKVQNIAQVPEENALRFGTMDRAKEELKDQLGRDPTQQELANYTGMSMSQVRRISNQRVRDLSSGVSEGALTHSFNPRDREVLPLLRNRLTEKQKKVFDQIYTHNTTSTGEIARKTGLSQSDVSEAKSQIIKAYEEVKLEKKPKEQPRSGRVEAFSFRRKDMYKIETASLPLSLTSFRYFFRGAETCVILRSVVDALAEDWERVWREELCEDQTIRREKCYVEKEGRTYNLLSMPCYSALAWLDSKGGSETHIVLKELQRWVRLHDEMDRSAQQSLQLLRETYHKTEQSLLYGTPNQKLMDRICALETKIQEKDAQIAYLESRVNPSEEVLNRIFEKLSEKLSEKLRDVRQETKKLEETEPFAEEWDNDPECGLEDDCKTPSPAPEQGSPSPDAVVVGKATEGEALAPTVVRKLGYLSARSLVEEYKNKYPIEGLQGFDRYYEDIYKVKRSNKGRSPKTLSAIVRYLAKEAKIYPLGEEEYVAPTDPQVLKLTQVIPLRIAVEGESGENTLRDIKHQVAYHHSVVEIFHELLRRNTLPLQDQEDR